MATIIRHGNVCEVMQISSKRTVEAVIQEFKEHVTLVIIVNKAIRIYMKWNGTSYEGRSAGMDFTSDGPVVTRTQTTARGY